jgi:DNA mismatch repair protein MutS2
MAFGAGDRVVVLPLGRKQGVVIDVGREGRYRVQVERTTISCRDAELAAVPEASGRKRKGTVPPGPAAPDTTPAIAECRVDLHGLTVEEALARVIDAIDASLRRGAGRLEIVHGKGSGRIRDALHRELKTLNVVASFRLDPDNPGVTWIYF